MIKKFKRLSRQISRNPLTSRHRVSALARYLRHQVLTRFGIKGGVLGWVLPFVDHTQVLARPDGYLNRISTFGLPEPSEMAFLLHSLAPSDVFLDVGANVGAYTVLASGVIGASSIAIEPIPSALSELKLNLSLNNIEDQVIIVPMAVGDRVATARMESNRGTTNRIASTDSLTDVLEVPLTTLDEVVPLDVRSLVVKIDVEGYETASIMGATRLLTSGSVQALIVETMGHGARYGYQESKLHEQILSFGYESCEYDPIHRQLLPGAPYKRLAKKYVTDSTIYVRNVSAMTMRLREARHFHVHGTGTDL